MDVFISINNINRFFNKMNKYPEQYIYDNNVWMVGDSPNAIRPTGKYPIIAYQQWETLEDAQSFIDDPNSTAIPGMVLSVVNDPDKSNNGVYFVKSIGDTNNSGGVKKGELSILAYTENVNSEINDIVTEFNQKIQDVVEKHEVSVIGLKTLIDETNTEFNKKIQDVIEKHEVSVIGLKTLIDDTNTKHEEDVKRIDSDIEEAQMYRSNVGDEWETEAIGDIKQGWKKTNSELTDKKINEVLDMLLYPTLQPIVNPEPSITLIYNDNSTSGQVTCINVGDNLPDETEFAKEYDRGSVNYTNSDGNKLYAGEGSETFSIINDMGENVEFGQTTTEGTYTVTYTVNFTEGAELLDNKKESANPDIRYMGGTLSATKIFNSVYPIYATTDENNIKEIVSQGANDYIANDIILTLSVADEDVNNKFTLMVPNYLTVADIKQYSSTSGDYNIDTKYMLNNKTTEEKNGIVYNVYKRATTHDDFIGSTQYQVTINKK